MARYYVKFLSTAMMLSMVLSSFPLGTVNKAEAALQTTGPVSDINGFPVWYQDTNGLALELCTDPNDPLCLADSPVPGNAFSEEIGFGSEAFWWMTEALMSTNNNGSIDAGGGGISALLVLAIEAAFATEDPAPGDQMAFSRLRIRVNVPAPGRYIVRHPFGTEVYSVAAVEPGQEIRDAVGAPLLQTTGLVGDIGCAGPPCDFNLALDGSTGPFLTSAAFAANPNAHVDPVTGARYVGPGIVAETLITGSPVGQNFFEIEGPGVDLDPGTPGNQRSVRTDLFGVIGKVAVIDTVPPTIVSTSPASVPVGSTNVVLSANITDDLGTTRVTADLGALSNTFTAALSGSQEVPPTVSPATGNGAFTIDTVANTLSFNISYSGLVGGPETAAHIHGPAAAGVNALPIFTLPSNNPKVGVWNYGLELNPEAIEAMILSGQTYLNIHTVLFPGGEIRGQILPTANVQNMILTAGTKTDGTWGLIIPNLTRAGSFTIPITATDGSNPITFNHSLTVQVLTSVNVTPAAATIEEGATQQFTATALDQFGNPMVPQPSLAWTSSDNNVATVNAAGLATGVAAGGPAIITASAGAISGNASLTVILPVLVFTSVNVTPAPANVAVGGTRQLTASALDQFGNAIILQPVFTWTSSDTTVATVDANGLVTGVAAGTATITAMATIGATTLSGNSIVTVATGPICQTTADNDGDGAISNLEVLNHVRSWKAGTVPNLEILNAIRFWKAGTGC